MDLARPRLVSREEIFAARPERARGVRFTSLWVAGSLEALGRPTVAIVGSRAPSDGGRSRARALAATLAGRGVCVISGLAYGIDAAAHAGSVDRASATIAVLGGGHRKLFPPRNRPLAEAILRSGGAVVSPFAPDEPARPAQFLQRNAIVAALSDAVVVVEAAERSGALNTARWASDLNVDVFAFPGDVDRNVAAGCNALIRDGAILVRGAEDVLEALRLASDTALPEKDVGLRERYASDGPALAILGVLSDDARSLEAIASATSLTPGETLATLVRLEIEGTIERRDGADFVLAD